MVTRARSPDLVPNEHVWDILGHIVRCHHAVRTGHQMISRLRHELAAVTQNDFKVFCYNLQKCFESKCVNHSIIYSINALKISINRITEYSVIFKKIRKYYCFYV